jgi:hypothetical protein
LIVGTICFGALGVCLLDILAVVSVAIWFRFRPGEPPQEEPLTIEAGTTTRTGLGFGRLSLIPLLHFRVEWREPRNVHATLVGTRAGYQEQIVPRQRGLADRIVRRYIIGDWLGLSRVRFDRRTERPARVLPWCGNAATFELVQQLRPGDILGHPEGQPVGDLVESRRYVSGDPLKLVLWKVYARTGQMLVRTPERAVAPTQRMLAYFVPAEGDEACAGIVRAALEAGLLGPEVIFMAEGAEGPATSPATGVDQLIRSINFRHSGGSALDRFLVRGETVGTSSAFIFVSPRVGAWLDRVCHVLKAHQGPFHAIVGVDEIGARSDSSTWRRVLWRAADERVADPSDLSQIRQRLAKSGVRVSVISRMTGETLFSDSPVG